MCVYLGMNHHTYAIQCTLPVNVFHDRVYIHPSLLLSSFFQLSGFMFNYYWLHSMFETMLCLLPFGNSVVI